MILACGLAAVLAFAVRSSLSQASGRTGRLGNCGTRSSSRCCPTRVPLAQISQLVGHRGTTVTEIVYRHQLRPVLQTGATVMDALFAAQDRSESPTGNG